MAELKRNWRVFDRDWTDTCRIANLKAGGERATKTAQSTFWSCCDTIRTQILNWSKKYWLLGSGFCVETRCNSSGPGWNRTRTRPGNLDPLLTLHTGGFPFRSCQSKHFLIIQPFAVCTIQWALSSWASSSSVQIISIKLFTADYNVSAPCFSITISFAGCSGTPENSHI